MSPLGAWGVLCGLGLGLGLWSLAGLLPSMHRPRLVDRVAPYLVDVSEAAREHARRRTASSLPVLGSLLVPVLGGLRSRASSMLGGGEAIAVRLRQSASTLTIEEFRLRQLGWALGAAGAGGALGAWASATRPVPAAVLVAGPLVLAAAGFLVPDRMLSVRVSRRLARMSEEFPTVLELLTLSLSAGEGIVDAIRRVARTGSGELAGELGRVIAETSMGTPLAVALTQASRDLRLPAFTRCVDAVVTALERGTPVVEVLRAQATDAREAAKRDLLEQAGKKEIGMLLPLVFLILPVTVLFAVYPGLVVLETGF
ncbi:type II secretion system F family protein [Humibacter albus]|uniref:type II secretion system F family protein n=1 Tax=Humibacter albus TaxID=427754 RepID=UPI000478ECD8|nr:type II secretion system F family protein [Humibacter albus]